ncbi:MAG: hypothetical protein JW726_02045 [Anaerolineales bacterium]|nr:hypothetical protein [Anaerolineales bacterium]
MEFLQRWRGTFLSLFFIGYLIFIQPGVLSRLQAISDMAIGDPLLGGILIALPIVELAGFYLKLPAYQYYRKHYPAKSGTLLLLLFIFLPLLHMGMAAMLCIAAFQVAGMRPGEAWFSFLVVFFLVIFKEAFLVVLMLYPGVNAPNAETFLQPGKDPLLKRLLPGVIPSEITLPLVLRDIAGDLLLLIFSALVYSTLWDFILMRSPIESGNLDFTLAQYLGVVFYFILVYPTARSFYYLQVAFIQHNRLSKVLLVLDLLATLTVALLTIPKQ